MGGAVAELVEVLETTGHFESLSDRTTKKSPSSIAHSSIVPIIKTWRNKIPDR
jgi:hypothetical protein